MLLQHRLSYLSSKRYVRNLPIVFHKYEMGHSSWINFSHLILLVFQKHDYLFPNHQKILTICHTTIQNNCQLCDNWRNIVRGLYQRVKLAVIDTSTVRCQKCCGKFDDMVPIFDNPIVSRSKTTYRPLKNDTSCGCPVAFFSISFPRTPLLTVGWCTQIFRV